MVRQVMMDWLRRTLIEAFETAFPNTIVAPDDGEAGERSKAAASEIVATAKENLLPDIERFMVFSVAMRSYESQERRDSSFDANLGVLFAALVIFYIETFKWAMEPPHAWALWSVFMCCLVSLVFAGFPLFVFRVAPEPKALGVSQTLFEDMRTGARGSVKQIAKSFRDEHTNLAGRSRWERLSGAFARRKQMAALFPTFGAAGALINETEFIGRGISSKRFGARLAIGVTVGLALLLWLPAVLQYSAEGSNAHHQLSPGSADLHRGSRHRQPEQHRP